MYTIVCAIVSRFFFFPDKSIIEYSNTFRGPLIAYFHAVSHRGNSKTWLNSFEEAFIAYNI